MSIQSTDQLRIKDEIRELMARYVRYADEKEWKLLAGLFTEDGVFTPLTVAGAPLAVMQGQQQIAATIGGSVGTATAIHHLFSYEIEVLNEDSAKGIFSMEDYLIRPEGAVIPPATQEIPAFRTLHGYGHYHGNYRYRDGRWQIEKLVQTRIKLDFNI
ncbi:nuclear transport factor 2 family protein [Chitinophaga sp. sic0106]|uniref:nuclear transport factor 2 family protein n=1 Tax=Chitinophaga sp. sic0106 TaxID=2854785 RepID=UPI001C46E055|nr:nuclear transport factor 2 family protein [Chitinophaga sp. sic0106]MBV7530383.1 nuclear transport factor 2 family protein [Chitinophaga sp. sic0106]